MKVTKIFLKNFLNFKNSLEIDLTYPKDHPKAGQPLDKVCFIGQSGTGKTTLLNLIKFFSFEDSINPDCLDQKSLSDENVGLEFLIGGTYRFSKWSKGNNEATAEGISNIELVYKGENSLTNKECKAYIIEHFLKNKGIKLLAFPFDTVRNFNKSTDLPQNYLEVIKKPEDEIKGPADKKSVSEQRVNYLEKEIWDFSIDNVYWVWEIVLDQIKEYEPGYIKKVNEFLSKLKEDKENASKYYEELTVWEKENENPLNKIVQKCLDKILSKFNLKVNVDIDFERSEHKKFGRLQQISDNTEVPISFLSTGTIQIIVTSIPLSVLVVKDAIVIFDEPERSLFPETQIDLIHEYTSLAQNSQFFFATHSPIVASAFEPCERIILDFDESGKVFYQKGTSPEGDDPNDLLHLDFGLKSVLGKKGKEALNKFIELKTQILSESDEIKKEKMMVEFMEINTQYKFGPSDAKHS